VLGKSLTIIRSGCQDITIFCLCQMNAIQTLLLCIIIIDVSHEMWLHSPRVLCLRAPLTAVQNMLRTLSTYIIIMTCLQPLYFAFSVIDEYTQVDTAVLEMLCKKFSCKRVVSTMTVIAEIGTYLDLPIPAFPSSVRHSLPI